MKYTPLQNLRKARARNKGGNKRIAKSLRAMAAMLDSKQSEEFSRREIRMLQTLRGMLSLRLHANALTKAMQITLDGNCKIVGGKYIMDLNPKDL